MTQILADTISFLQAVGNATALSLDPRVVTVSANNQDRPFAAPNPPLTYVVAPAGTNTGLVDGSTLSGNLATVATQTSPSGTYAITQGTLSASPNYQITFVPGTLKVDLPPLQALNSFLLIYSPLTAIDAELKLLGDNGCAPERSKPGSRNSSMVLIDASHERTCTK